MSDRLVIGIDSSTTACKAIAWSAGGSARAEGRATYTLENPEPDGWEQDAESWWTAALAAVRDCVRALARDERARVEALAVTNQRETFVLTDDVGAPLCPALVWMDARCRPQAARAAATMGEGHLRELTGKHPFTTPSAYKIAFLLERRPELRALKPRVLDVHAMLVWRMTGRFATSLPAADPMGLIDMTKRCWSPEMLDFIGVGIEQVPELVEAGASIGGLTDDVARAMDLPSGLPVVAGAGDGQCAGLGAGIATSDRAYLNLGTAIVSGVSSEKYVTDTAFRTLYGAAPRTFFLETDLHGGTFSVNWFVEKLLGRPGGAIDDLDARAAALPPGAGGLLLVPYLAGVMNPYWDADASGLCLGLRGHHGPEHVFRAVLEGIAFEQRVHTTGVEDATQTTVDEFVAMGGGSKSDLWCQIVSDVTRKRVTRSVATEATALGAGMLAAVAVGIHADAGAAALAMTGSGRTFVPGANADRYDALYERVYRGLYGSNRDAMHSLAELSRSNP